MHLLVLYCRKVISTLICLSVNIIKYSNGPSLTLFYQVRKCSKCKKDLKAVVKIEKQLQLMHRDFRKIMDRINDTNAQENIKKFSALLTEVEKVKVFFPN